MRTPTETTTHVTHSPEETAALARDLAGRLCAGDVVVLDGPLGAGKTCFVRGLADGLGLDPAEVSSPTFIIRQEYERRSGDRTGDARRLVHVDAYRLSGPEELDSIGWSELLAAGDAIVAIEWPSRIEAALPERCIRVELEHRSETERRVTISGSSHES